MRLLHRCVAVLQILSQALKASALLGLNLRANHLAVRLEALGSLATLDYETVS